jgi:hypothetical protein
LHFREGDNGSLEGIFVGFWAGHYVIRTAQYLESDTRTHDLGGVDVKVHRDRVLFLQELTR